MNGIITFDDGSGTVIEDGVISTTNLSTDNLTVSTLLKTDTIESTNNVDGKLVYVYCNLGGDDIINLGENCKTYIANSCIIDNGSANLFNDALIVSSDAVFANELKGVATANNVNLYTTTTGTVSLGNTGKVKLGNTVSITGNTVASTNATDAVNILTATTGDISLGSTGKVKLGNTVSITGNTIASTNASDAVNILTATTGNIGIGSSGQIKVGNSVSITDKTIATSAVSDTVNLFNNITTGVVNMAKFAIKKNQIRGEDNTLPVNLFDDQTGIISMCSGLRLSQNKIDCADAGTTYRLFDTLTSGALYVGTGLLTGSCNIGSTLSTGTLNLGNTLGAVAGNMGDVIIGNDTNNLTTAGNGTCTINKLRLGTSPVMRNVRYGTVAGGNSGATVNFSPAFPSGQSIFIVGNIQSNNASQVFSLCFSSVNATSFRYRKNFVGTPFVLGGATSEEFDYFAWSN